jgi:hypothetical protein
MKIFRIFGFITLIVPLLSENFYTKYDNFKVTDNLTSEIKTIYVKRKFDCLTSCNLNQQCSLVSLNIESQKCTLYEITDDSLDISSNLISSNELITFEKVNLYYDQGRRYLLFKYHVPWDQVNYRCRRFNARLFELRNQEDLNFGKFIAEKLSYVFWVNFRNSHLRLVS